MSKENEKTVNEKKKVIDQYILLKKKHQDLYFKYQMILVENSKLKLEINKLKDKSNEEKILPPAKKSIDRKNQSSLSLEESQCDSATEKVKFSEPNRHSGEFEVEKLVKHRGPQGNRQFQVRWKNFQPNDDTWEDESNLSCPKILNKYKKKHKLV